MVEPLPQSETPASWQRTILVVDDEDIVRGLVARSLREGGYDPAVPMLRKPFLPSRLLKTVEELLTGPDPVRRRAEGA